MSTGAKPFSAPVGEQRSFILFPAPPVPSAQLPPISAGHRPAQRQQALIATVLNYWKRASYAKLTSPNSVLWWSPNHTIQGQENGKMPSFHGHFQGGRKKLKTRDPWETDPIHWATQITPLSFQEENRNGMCKKTRHEDWPVRSIQWRNPDHFDIHSSKHWLNIYHVSGSNPGKESEWEVGVLGESYASTVENTRSHAAGTGTLSASKKDILTPSLKDPFLAGRMLEVLAF